MYKRTTLNNKLHLLAETDNSGFVKGGQMSMLKAQYEIEICERVKNKS